MSSSATPAPGTPIPPRGEFAPPVGSELPPHYRHCFGCGNEHPTGLHLKVRVGEGLVIEGAFTVAEEHQGAPGLAHGGLLATAFDEALGYLMWLVGAPSVTARLEVDYRRPVPIGSVMEITAWVTGIDGRKVYTQAEGKIDGVVHLNARALFLSVPYEHFETHGWADAAADVRDELEKYNPFNP